jgi:hypothetical protein
MNIDRKTSVEDLVEKYPKVAGWMTRRGLRCVVCGEPFWGTLGELADDSGFDDAQVDTLIADMQAEIDAGHMNP